jgi:hypothetical protein
MPAHRFVLFVFRFYMNFVTKKLGNFFFFFFLCETQQAEALLGFSVFAAIFSVSYVYRPLRALVV